MTDATPTTPDLDRLPLLAAGVGMRADRFRKALAVVAAHLPQGAIPNPRYEDIRSGIMDGLAEAWNAGVPETLMEIARTGLDNRRLYDEGTPENAAHKLSHELRMSAFEGLAVVPRVEKRLAAAIARAPDGPDRDRLTPGLDLMAEIRVVSDAMAWLRERRVKRMPPGSAPPPPELPKATREAESAVREHMRGVLEPLRQSFKGYVVERVRKQADMMERTCAKAAALIAAERARQAAERAAGLTPTYRQPEGFRNLRDIAEVQRRVGRHLADYDPNTYAFKRHADGERRVEAYAAGEVEKVFHLCTERNVAKIAPIAEAKGGVSIEVHRATASYEGVKTELTVSFPDGASFGFSNSIVYAISNRGMEFARFPALYHAAHRADGTRIRNPTEARLKQEFIPGFVPGAEPAEPDADAPPGP